jgi:molybdate transport system substrate-binding protein
MNHAAVSVIGITNGAAADVYASADEKNMAKVADPAVFATNRLRIAVPPDNPAGITSFADLARPGVTVVVCAPRSRAAPRRTRSNRRRA